MRDASIGTIHQRGAVRRVAPLRCEAVSLERYSMLGTKVLDISETGMLLAAEGDPADLRELVLVHLFDGASEVVVQAEVARVLRGRRPHDRGVALGLAFTRAGGRAFRRLMGRLRGTPPPVPRRRLRRDYASAVAALAGGGIGTPERESAASIEGSSSFAVGKRATSVGRESPISLGRFRGTRCHVEACRLYSRSR